DPLLLAYATSLPCCSTASQMEKPFGEALFCPHNLLPWLFGVVLECHCVFPLKAAAPIKKNHRSGCKEEELQHKATILKVARKQQQKIPTNIFHLIRYKFIYITTESKTEWRRGWSICCCHLCKPYPNFCVVSTCCSALRDLCCASLLSNGPAGRMLGMARPTQNSAGAVSRLQSQ
ncbi:hypothetical protein Nmel_006695, partial [Mimus melanotis]